MSGAILNYHIVTSVGDRVVRYGETLRPPAERWAEIQVATIREDGNNGVKVLRLTLWELHRIAFLAGLDPAPWPESAPEGTES